VAGAAPGAGAAAARWAGAGARTGLGAGTRAGTAARAVSSTGAALVAGATPGPGLLRGEGLPQPAGEWWNDGMQGRRQRSKGKTADGRLQMSDCRLQKSKCPEPKSATKWDRRSKHPREGDDPAPLWRRARRARKPKGKGQNRGGGILPLGIRDQGGCRRSSCSAGCLGVRQRGCRFSGHRTGKSGSCAPAIQRPPPAGRRRPPFASADGLRDPRAARGTTVTSSVSDNGS